MPAGHCPICFQSSNLEIFPDEEKLSYRVACLRCGQYLINGFAKDCVERALRMDKQEMAHYVSMSDDQNLKAPIVLYVEVAKIDGENGGEHGGIISGSILSHCLSKRNNIGIPLTCELITDVLKNNSLPTPAEQANNFIIYLGKRLYSLSEHLALPSATYQAGQNISGVLGLKIGSYEWRDLCFIIGALSERKILDVASKPEATAGGQAIPARVSLTMDGWHKYEELQRSVKNSRKAFVAMEFPNPSKKVSYFFQDTLLDKYLVPAAKKAGYELGNALRSEPMAGNIHAKLEVEVRASRFVVAELSYHNNGAYWEAGFARGLGKPVIYMYNKTTGKSDRPHFDVGSDHYVAWEEDKPGKAADDLKAVIPATLFSEAVMED